MRTEAKTIVTSVTREPLEKMYPPEGKLPSLIKDARENPLVKQSLREGDVLVKSPAFPYVEHHMLVIPDRADQGNTPSIAHVPERLLAKTFATVGQVAEHYSENPDIKEVNIGWNHSPQEDKKHVATKVNTLHVHVVGMTQADLGHTVSLDEIKTRPELKTKEQEPLAGLITSVVQREVFVHLKGEAGFSDRFKKIDDGRITYELSNGLNEFADPAFAHTMKAIHELTALAYEQVASCFFERDASAQNETTDSPSPEQRESITIYKKLADSFIEKNVDASKPFAETEDGRYKLLSQEERKARIDAYVSTRKYLSPLERHQLTFLASEAQSMDDLHVMFKARKEAQGDMTELSDDEKYGRSPEMAIKGLAYAAVITGVKQDNGEFSWRFGIDPVVFAPRDVVQASRGTFAHFERKDEVMSADRLAAMKKDERKLADRLLSKAANRVFLV